MGVSGRSPSGNLLRPHEKIRAVATVWIMRVQTLGASHHKSCPAVYLCFCIGFCPNISAVTFSAISASKVQQTWKVVRVVDRQFGLPRQ